MDTKRDDGSLRLGWKGLLAIFAFWTFLATLSAASRILDPRGFGFRGMSPTGPVLLAFVESWLWAAVTPPVFWLARTVGLERRRAALRILLYIVAGVIISAVIYFILAVARDELLEVARRRRPVRFRREFASLRFVPQLLYYLAILTTGFARIYFIRSQQQQAHTAQLQAQLAQARLDALRMQLNPHFLFNTLHSVTALVERNPAGVRKMIARLSELLRHTIDSHSADEVPLREEMDFLRRYLDIMEVRFQGRLRVEVAIDPDTMELLVPNLILQPVVENALEHGAGRARGESVVVIESVVRDGRLLLTVRDNGPGIVENPSPGVGVANTRARLEQLYGGAGSLTLGPAEGGGTVAEITIPIRRSSIASTEGELP